MFRFPFWSYPYYYNHYMYNLPNGNFVNTPSNKNTSIATNTNISDNTSTSRSSTSKEESPIFEFLGIKLYLDDIIILCLLFFLYQEKVHDEMLYIILFLLLFS